MDILVASGDIVTCGPDLEPDLFWATVGGLGLTGIILTVEIKLQRISNPMIEMESIRVENLEHFFEVSAESKSYSHTVSWVDCISGGDSMGRGIFMRGGHASADAEASKDLLTQATELFSSVLSVPFDGPNWLMNNWTMRAFNEPISENTRKARSPPFVTTNLSFSRWTSYAIGTGFTAIVACCNINWWCHTTHSIWLFVKYWQRSPSRYGFVLKRHQRVRRKKPWRTIFPGTGRHPGDGLSKFWRPLLNLLDRLDEIVVAAGGRIYLGKDALALESKLSENVSGMGGVESDERQVGPRRNVSIRFGHTTRISRSINDDGRDLWRNIHSRAKACAHIRQTRRKCCRAGLGSGGNEGHCR